jgi:hypothetical protein
MVREGLTTCSGLKQMRASEVVQNEQVPESLSTHSF